MPKASHRGFARIVLILQPSDFGLVSGEDGLGVRDDLLNLAVDFDFGWCFHGIPNIGRLTSGKSEASRIRMTYFESQSIMIRHANRKIRPILAARGLPINSL